MKTKVALTLGLLTCLTLPAQTSWTNRFQNPLRSGNAPLLSSGIAVATGPSSDVAVAGWATSTNSFIDFCTLKYAASGAILWTNRYHGLGFNHDQVTAVAMDSSGSVYVTGSSASTNLSVGPDYATLKYSSAGVPVWTNRYDGPGQNSDYPVAMAVDANDNLFVTGYSWGGPATNYDITTIKYTSAGTTSWIQRYNGPRSSEDVPTAINVDKDGNILVAGYTPGPPNGLDANYNMVVLKYDNNGASLWTNYFIGAPGFNDQASAITTDSNGDVLVAGWSNQNGGGVNQFVTLKYSGAGVPLWTNFFVLFPFNNEKAVGIAVDSSRSVYVTGTSGATSSQLSTLKYTSAGVPVWTNSQVTVPGDSAVAKGIVVDGNNNAFVTGSSSGSLGSTYLTLKYNATTGKIIATNRYAAGSAAAITMDPIGNAIVTGVASNDCVTIRYAAPAPPAPFFIVSTNSHFGFSNQLFSFDVSGPANSNVVILGSSNLQNWVALRTNSLGSGTYYFNDAQTAANRWRFYRAQLLP